MPRNRFAPVSEILGTAALRDRAMLATPRELSTLSAKQKAPKLLSAHEIWSSEGRLTTWEADRADSAARAGTRAGTRAEARTLSLDTHDTRMELYQQFGEECASRNLVPSYRLFEQWLESDAVV